MFPFLEFSNLVVVDLKERKKGGVNILFMKNILFYS